MNARVFLLVLAMLLAGLSCADGPAEPETITIAGTEYRVIPDEVFREMGFEFPDVPREENAAYDYIRAINAYKRPTNERELERLAVDLRRGRASWGEAQEVREHVEKNRETLARLSVGAAKKQCHFPFVESPGADESLSPVLRRSLAFAPIRQMARFLSIAGSMHEHDGDFAQAMAFYADIVALATHVAQNRVFIDVLVGEACCGIGLGDMMRCAAEHAVSSEVLVQTQQRLADVRAEQPTSAELVQMIRAENTQHLELVLPPLPEMGFFSRPGTLRCMSFLDDVPEWKLWLIAVLVEVPAFRESVWRYNDEMIEAAEALLHLPPPECVQRRDEVIGAVRRRYPFGLQEAIIGDTFITFVLWRSGRHDLSWTVTDVFLALARYKAEHGAYPERIEQAKDLMLSDGLDPFSGELLKYRREADGSFTIWSVGEDLKDDGGKIEEGKVLWQCADYVWTSQQ